MSETHVTDRRGGKSSRKSGQAIIEYAVLILAVASAIVLMSNYVLQAFSAHAKSLEAGLNFGAGG